MRKVTVQFFYHLVVINANGTELCIKSSQFCHVLECCPVGFNHPERLVKYACLDKNSFCFHPRLFKQLQKTSIFPGVKTHHNARCYGVAFGRASSFPPLAFLILLSHLSDILVVQKSGTLTQSITTVLIKKQRLRSLLFSPWGQAVLGYVK